MGRCRVKLQGAIGIASKHAVEDQRVEVHIEIERRSEALHAHSRTTAPIRNAPPAGVTPVPAQDRPHEHGDDSATEGVVPCQGVPYPRRQGQDPLPDRYIGEYVVHQMRCALGYAASTAARTEASPLA